MVRLGILSTAHIHMPNFVKVIKARTDVQVAGVYDPNPELAKKYGAELNAPVVDCACKILDDATIPAVMITGTTAQHNQLVVPAAQAKKHMFVEKPLAVTSEDANRMYAAIKKARVLFQTGHFMRATGMNRFIKQEIAAGNLGRITRARSSNCHSGAIGRWFDTDYRWFTEQDQAGGGGFYDLGCHSLDLLISLFGPVAEATGCIGGESVTYQNIDEYGEGMMRFKNGVIGTVAAGWVDVAHPVSLIISGTEGHMSVIHGQLWYKSAKSTVAGADHKQAIDPSVFPVNLAGPLDCFFDVLNDKADKSLLIPIEDSMNVAKTMEAMYQGNKLGAWVKVI